MHGEKSQSKLGNAAWNLSRVSREGGSSQSGKYLPEGEHYVRKAGGYTDRAREGDVKIVKAKTKQWLSPRETAIESGDYIWVPKEIERPFSYYMNIIGQTASIVSVAVSVVLLVIQINK